MLRRNGPVINL